MKVIQVYDPPVAFSAFSGSNMEVDPELLSFTTMLAVLGRYGIKIERYNFGLNPTAFAENPAVKALLLQLGTDVLPVIFWDGKLQLTGRYPTAEERSAWFVAASHSEDTQPG